MIRIGVDIVDIERLERRLAATPRLAERLFTESELRYAAAGARPSEHLAARFAAKEATFKALGEGWPKISWHEVEVIRNGGRPRLVLRGAAAAAAGDREPLVSMSHDGGVAVAQVVLVGDGGS
jgi:holo-[acyl-carrier protein] synthase